MENAENAFPTAPTDLFLFTFPTGLTHGKWYKVTDLADAVTLPEMRFSAPSTRGAEAGGFLANNRPLTKSN